MSLQQAKTTNEFDEIVDESNLVAFSENIDPTVNPLHNKIERLVELLKEHEKEVDERFQDIEPITTVLTELAADLGMRTATLEDVQRELEKRAEGFETAHGELAARTASLAVATDNMRTENDRRAESQEESIVDLQSKSNELEQMNHQLGEEIECERSRLNKLTPRVSHMEDTSDELLKDTADLQQETGEIRKFFKTAVWSISGVVLLLAIAAGALYYFQNKNTLSISTALTDLGVQKQKIVEIEDLSSAMYVQMQAIPAKFDAVYKIMTEKDAELELGINAANTDIAEIKERIFIPDENLSTGAYDLSLVKNDSWLMRQSAKSYTIQIVGLYGKNALSNFVGRYRKHLDLNSIAYLQTTRKGRDWYVLTQGSYVSAADAQVAIEKMPASLQKNSPYVRKFERIQERVDFRISAK